MNSAEQRHLDKLGDRKEPGTARSCAVNIINEADQRVSLVFYHFFFQSLVISSRVLPLVSGTHFQTKMAAAMQMQP